MNMTTATLFYSALAGAATILGIRVMIRNSEAAKKYASLLMPFAAGIIMATAFFHLIPEAFELNGNAHFYILGGFLVFYLFESTLLIHAGPELHHIEHAGDEKLNVSAKVAFSGLLFHSFIDGIIIGIGFEVDQALGLFTTLGIVMHELPEGITTYSLLMLTEPEYKARRKSYMVALATPTGALFSLLFIGKMSEPVIGSLLAFAAGSFIYVAASDLIPETHNHKGFSNVISLMSGVVVIFLISCYL